MTPTQAHAIVGKDGSWSRVYHTQPPSFIISDGQTILPVTIIPTADLVREAARVLLGAGLTRYEPHTSMENAVLVKDINGDCLMFDDLRALAGGE